MLWVQLGTVLKPLYILACLPNRRVVNDGAGCSIKRDNGFYRAEITQWQELDNCKCVPRETVSEKLCACEKPREETHCEDQSLLVTERTKFFKRDEDNQCIAEKETHRRKIRKKVSKL